ncbi:MAG TPA: hypothetical protein VLS49_09705 [Usitatibacter sp.]|nr:hypothetical protein [Usitatibacter sp.]
MNRTILVTCFCAAALAGCGRTIVREERVVEQPVVTRETVVERPAVTREAIVAAPAACSLAGYAYSSGTMSCQAGYEYRCRDGVWERIAGSSC